MSAPAAKPDLLKLRAEDAEDIQVISAMLQDAIVPLCDIVFQDDQKVFVVVAQRLRRERGETGAGERVCCAVTIKGVGSVQTRGIDQKQQTRMLDLLAIMIEGTSLNLVFADDAHIRLDLSAWTITVEDFGESWPALCHPCHEDAAKSL